MNLSPKLRPVEFSVPRTVATSRLASKLLFGWVASLCFGAMPGLAEILVVITDPPAGQAIFDDTMIRAEVMAGESIRQVEFKVDGKTVGSALKPPYQVQVNVGSDNREHTIEVIAHGGSGGQGRSRMRTPRVAVNEVVEVDLQQLYVTVTGRGGRRVLDLERSDFAIHDEGKIQRLETFARGDIPFTAVLMVDGSKSMQGRRLEASLAGAQRFVRGMRPLDEAKLMVFSDRLLRITPWQKTSAPLADALEEVEAAGGTAIFDHLHLGLTRLEARQGRRVIILLTDGWDSLSALTAEQVRRVARRSQALIYWVRLIGDEPGEGRALGRRSKPTLMPVRLLPTSSWRDVESSRRAYELLEKTVKESGGRVVSVSRIATIEAAFVDLLAELREQYALGYSPDPRRNDGSWRQVNVRIQQRGLKARVRDGYVDR